MTYGKPKLNKYRESNLDTALGVPTNIDDYVEYFNRTYSFAKASVGIDHNGRKYVDLKWK